MGTKKTDQELREQLRAWVNWHARGYPSDTAMAKKMGISKSYLSQVKSGERTGGLEMAAALRRIHADLNAVFDHYPREADNVVPSDASPMRARPARPGVKRAAH